MSQAAAAAGYTAAANAAARAYAANAAAAVSQQPAVAYAAVPARLDNKYLYPHPQTWYHNQVVWIWGLILLKLNTNSLIFFDFLCKGVVL